jgi:hypothetical protein
MRSYPIWNIVDTDSYTSGKSYGARDWTRTEVRVGTSASNSEVLCSHAVVRNPILAGEWVEFRFEVEFGGTYETLACKYMHVKTHRWQDLDPREAPALVRQALELGATA